jgi:hypothetical protein
LFSYSLGYTDPVIDGFYLTHGDFPEICDKDKFPSLEELKKVQTEEEDIREVRMHYTSSNLVSMQNPRS